MSDSVKWLRPQAVSDVTLAFPASVEELMPRYEDVPEEFRTGTVASAPWYKFQAHWFAVGLDDMKGVHPSEALTDAVLDDLEALDGVTEESARDAMQQEIERAFRHLGAIQGSFQPKHEHKVAAVAWLASLWFSEVVWKEKGRV